MMKARAPVRPRLACRVPRAGRAPDFLAADPLTRLLLSDRDRHQVHVRVSYLASSSDAIVPC